MRALLPALLLCLLLTTWSPSLAVPDPEPLSYGFSNPDDVQSLYDYRLPDWTYRNWRLNLDLNGRGSKTRVSEGSHHDNDFRTQLSTIFRQDWENDLNNYYLAGSLLGTYSHLHDGSLSGTRSQDYLRGLYGLDAGMDRYLGQGPFFVSGQLSLNGEYREETNEYSPGDADSNDHKRLLRSSTRGTELGFGMGRVRNVEPLIRAERMNERLQALGKPALDRQAVLRVARALAKQGGYGLVYSRPDRRFWEEVLEPVLVEAGSLSPYEMHYLAEALEEYVGNRNQGWSVRATYGFTEGRGHDLGSGDIYQKELGPTLQAHWSHNLSLEHQISLRASYSYQWSDSYGHETEFSLAGLELSHLWLLTDRHRLESALGASHNSRHENRMGVAQLNFRFFSRLEDKLSLMTALEGGYQWTKDPMDREAMAWRWQYQLGLVYYLDKFLL
jgi:hypothetical protein